MSMKILWFSVIGALLAACTGGGSVSDGAAVDGDGGVTVSTAVGSAGAAGVPANPTGTAPLADGGPLPGADSCATLFADRVQPRFGVCRSCHSPGGIAEATTFGPFALSQDATEDYENLVASWQRLGKNDFGLSPILTMAAGTSGEPHSGGYPWQLGTEAYVDIEAMLLGLDDPTACDAGGTGAVEHVGITRSMLTTDGPS